MDDEKSPRMKQMRHYDCAFSRQYCALFTPGFSGWGGSRHWFALPHLLNMAINAYIFVFASDFGLITSVFRLAIGLWEGVWQRRGIWLELVAAWFWTWTFIWSILWYCNIHHSIRFLMKIQKLERAICFIYWYLTLEVKYEVKCHVRVRCSGTLAIVWDNFGKRADVISGRYSVPRPLTLNLTLNVKYQIKGYGRVSC